MPQLVYREPREVKSASLKKKKNCISSPIESHRLGVRAGRGAGVWNELKEIHKILNGTASRHRQGQSSN